MLKITFYFSPSLFPLLTFSGFSLKLQSYFLTHTLERYPYLSYFLPFLWATMWLCSSSMVLHRGHRRTCTLMPEASPSSCSNLHVQGALSHNHFSLLFTLCKPFPFLRYVFNVCCCLQFSVNIFLLLFILLFLKHILWFHTRKHDQFAVLRSISFSIIITKISHSLLESSKKKKRQSLKTLH